MSRVRAPSVTPIDQSGGTSVPLHCSGPGSGLGDAPLAQRQSNGLLIRRFWVRNPGGAPRSTRSTALSEIDRESIERDRHQQGSRLAPSKFDRFSGCRSTEHASKPELIAPGFITSGWARSRPVAAVRSASTATCSPRLEPHGRSRTVQRPTVSGSGRAPTNPLACEWIHLRLDQRAMSSASPPSKKRSPRGAGTITAISPGVWKIGVTAAVDPLGQRRRTFRTIYGTRNDAATALAALVTEVGDGHHLVRQGDKQLTLDSLVAWYLEFAREDRGLDHSTLTGYADAYSHWLKEPIGHKRANSITTAELDNGLRPDAPSRAVAQQNEQRPSTAERRVQMGKTSPQGDQQPCRWIRVANQPHIRHATPPHPSWMSCCACSPPPTNTTKCSRPFSSSQRRDSRVEQWPSRR